jgi:hypothetical protein
MRRAGDAFLLAGGRFRAAPSITQHHDVAMVAEILLPLRSGVDSLSRTKAPPTR